MHRYKAFALLRERVPSLTPDQRLACVNAFCDPPDDFRAGVTKGDLETAEIAVPGPETIAAGEAFIAGMADPLDFPDGPMVEDEDSDGNTYARPMTREELQSQADAMDDPDLDESIDDAIAADWRQVCRIAVQVAALHATVTTNPCASVRDISDTAAEIAEAYLRRIGE